MRRICSDPEIVVYDNILSVDECNHLIKLSKHKLKRAQVIGTQSLHELHATRTGSSCFVAHRIDPVTHEITKRLSKLVGLPLTQAEPLQIIHYGPTEEYKYHYDSVEQDGSDKNLKFMEYGGARLKTVLCYLNEGFDGGGTRFRRIKKTIQPRIGRVLVFDNTYKHIHDIHPLSEHCGLPVKRGEKYAANLWFRECSYSTLYKDFNPTYYRNKGNKKP